jgi:hypothetical protein
VRSASRGARQPAEFAVHEQGSAAGGEPGERGGGSADTGRQASGAGEGTGERAGPPERTDCEHDGLGIDDEGKGCYRERDTERMEMEMERLLDGDFKKIYLLLPIQSDLPTLLELL